MEESGPAGARIRRVAGGDAAELAAAAELLQQIFPEYAYYEPYLRICAQTVAPEHPHLYSHVWLVEVEGRPVGLRVFHYLPRQNFGFSSFMGLLPPYRGSGQGSWLMRQTLAQLCRDAAAHGQPEPLGCCSEVEPVRGEPEGREREVRGRRQAFFRKAGGILLDVDYLEPPWIHGVSYFTPESLADAHLRRLDLLFCPVRPRPELSLKERVAIVAGIYRDYYQVSRGSWYLCRALYTLYRSEQRRKSQSPPRREVVLAEESGSRAARSVDTEGAEGEHGAVRAPAGGG